MKTYIFAAGLLTISLVTMAQPSRRNEGDRRSNDRRDHNENQHQVSRDNRERNNNARFETNRDSHREFSNSRDERRNDRAISMDRGNERDRGFKREVYAYNSHRDNNYNYRPSYRRPIFDIQHRHYVEPIEIRRSRFPYRVPVCSPIIWSISMYNDYRTFYPEVSNWRYPIGYRVVSVSAYDARDYIGEVANIYGSVADTYYNPEADEYYLYLGESFPYQDFTVIIPGYEARRFSRTPEYYFSNVNISVTGYVNNGEGKPEIVVRRANQLSVY